MALVRDAGLESESKGNSDGHSHGQRRRHLGDRFAVTALLQPFPERGAGPIQGSTWRPRPGLPFRVFALTGEEVYSVSQQGQAGANNLWWNLENQAGSNLASGLYLYRVEVEGVAGSFFKTGKVVLLH